MRECWVGKRRGDGGEENRQDRIIKADIIEQKESEEKEREEEKGRYEGKRTEGIIMTRI